MVEFLPRQSGVWNMRTTQGFLAVLFVTSWLVTGCASPTAPSTPDVSAPAPVPAGGSAAQLVTLTVRVFTRTGKTPLQGALVQMGQSAARVDASGACEFTLTTGTEASVDVSAPGYVPFGASGVLNSSERWTFYLERTNAPAGAASFSLRN